MHDGSEQEYNYDDKVNKDVSSFIEAPKFFCILIDAYPTLCLVYVVAIPINPSESGNLHLLIYVARKTRSFNLSRQTAHYQHLWKDIK